MKELVFTFYRYGYFMNSLKATDAFRDESHLRLIIKPAEYELKVSGDVLTKASCKGYIIEISHKGEVCFYDYENKLLARSDETEKQFKEFGFQWSADVLTVSFGHEETVDNYPNCDGEYDRWSTEWVTDYQVELNIATNTVKATA